MMPLILSNNEPDYTEEYINEYIAEMAIPAPFVFRVRPVKTELSIEQVRLIKRELVTANDKRLFVLYEFETASLEAQNALLKTLEDQGGSVSFIMVTNNIERVIPTIRSRSRIIARTAPRLSVRPETESLYSSVARAKGSEFLGDPLVSGIDRAAALLLIDELILLMRVRLADHPQLAAAMKYAISSKDLLESNNLNPQLCVDGVLIQLKKALPLDLPHNIP